jgi:hypothetical protein
MAEPKVWSCMIQGKVLGPMTRTDVLRMMAKGMLRDVDYVRYGTTSSWEQLVYARRQLETIEAKGVDTEGLEKGTGKPSAASGKYVGGSAADEEASVDFESPEQAAKRLRNRRAVLWGLGFIAAVILAAALWPSDRAPVRHDPGISRIAALSADDPEASFKLFAEQYVAQLREVSATFDQRDSRDGVSVTNRWDQAFTTSLSRSGPLHDPYSATLTVGRRVDSSRPGFFARQDGLMTFRFGLLDHRWVLREAVYEADYAQATNEAGLGITTRRTSDELSDPRISGAFGQVEQ